MRHNKRIVVIGGGAAGMVAAIAAARGGGGVLVVERMSRVGKKLLATGNGRCNLANAQLHAGKFHGASPDFIRRVLRQFDLDKTLAFFEELGVETRVEDEGKIFPLSGQASSVLDVLRHEMERLGVETICEANVSEIRLNAPGRKKREETKKEKRTYPFTCLCTNGDEFPADRVLVAAGGKSAPNMGSNGGGFKLAEKLGHRVVAPFPALVQVNLDAPFLKRLKGLKVEGEAEVRVEEKPRRKEKGELLFTDYGISGPPILQLSRFVSEAEARGQAAALRLDLFPETSEKELADRLVRRLARDPGKSVEFSFVGLIHKRLIPVVLKEAGLDNLGSACGDLSEKEILGVAKQMKNWVVPCRGARSWMHSQVTAGGVDADEVDPETLESRLVPGVFFAGEILDVDGDSGGYNLQWAWSTGHAAGIHAAK